MATYGIKEPPNAKKCDTHGCLQTATVRVTTPAEMLGGGDPAENDQCCRCWDQLRAALHEQGHDVTDATGDLAGLMAEFPGVSAFRSDGGVLYAAVNGATYDAYLVSQMRAQLKLATQPATA